MQNEVELIDVPRVIYGLRVVDELAKCFASGVCKKPRKQFGYWKRAEKNRLLEQQKQKQVEYETD